MNYILINKENYADFLALIPLSIYPEDGRIILGAYSDDGDIIGVISFELSDNEYNLDWLFVAPSMRGRGVAKGLLREVFRFISVTGEVYPLSAEFEVTEEDNSLYGFFLSQNDMDVSFSHLRYYVSAEELKTSHLLNKTVNIVLGEKKFFDLTGAEQNRVINEMTADHRYFLENREKWGESCIEKLCRVMYSEDRVIGTIFVQRRTDGNLELSYLYSKNPLCTKKLVNETAKGISEFYPRCSLIFDTVDEGALKMARKLFPSSKTVNIYQAEWGI